MIPYQPLITPDIMDALDTFITGILRDSRDAAVGVCCRDHRVIDIYPEGWPTMRIAHSLGLYMDLRRDKWSIEYRSKIGRYYVSHGSNKKNLGRICKADFDTLTRHIESTAGLSSTILLSVQELRADGVMLRTKPEHRALMLRAYLGLHPEYRVLSASKRYDARHHHKVVVYTIEKTLTHKMREAAVCL